MPLENPMFPKLKQYLIYYRFDIVGTVVCWFQKFMEGEFKEIVAARSENFAEDGMS